MRFQQTFARRQAPPTIASLAGAGVVCCGLLDGVSLDKVHICKRAETTCGMWWWLRASGSGSDSQRREKQQHNGVATVVGSRGTSSAFSPAATSVAELSHLDARCSCVRWGGELAPFLAVGYDTLLREEAH